MALSFNSNIQALRALRQLDASGRTLTRSFERLSAGQRIIRASDDSAGLAISSMLKNSARLYSAANRNINDGLSALNIMSGALEQQSSVLQRLMELAQQAANGSLTNTQRATLSEEYRSLVSEFGRLGDTTSFNNLTLLKGSRSSTLGSLLLQAGVNGSSSSILRVNNVNTSTYSGTFEIGERGTADANFTTEGLAAAYDNELLAVTIRDSSGTERDLLVGFDFGADAPPNSIYIVKIYQRASDSGGVGGITAGGDIVTAGSEWVLGNSTTLMVDGATGQVSSTTSASLEFDNGARTGTVQLDLRGLLFTGIPQNYSSTPQGTTTSIEFTGIEIAARALDAIGVLQARLNELSGYQGQIGAIQSRLASALEVTSASRENLTAADSRIRDIDVASETALLTASQIRQQTATAVLAQATQAPQLALNLLANLG